MQADEEKAELRGGKEKKEQKRNHTQIEKTAVHELCELSQFPQPLLILLFPHAVNFKDKNRSIHSFGQC